MSDAPKFTDEQVRALSEAVFYALDDMRSDGLSVCAYVKAMLRVAYEPFHQDDLSTGCQVEPMDLSFEDARSLISEVDAGR